VPSSSCIYYVAIIPCEPVPAAHSTTCE